MAAKQRIAFWAIVMIAAFLLTACNPITAEPDMATSVPTSLLSPEREPMQASLDDFATVFALIDDDGLEPELYADAILKIADCLESDEDFESEIALLTLGQRAAFQWTVITGMMALSFIENTDSDGDPEFYFGLRSIIQTNCMDDQ